MCLPFTYGRAMRTYETRVVHYVVANSGIAGQATAQETKKPPAEHTMAGCVQKGDRHSGVVENTLKRSC